MLVQKFTSADAMVKYLKGLTPSDHFKIAKSIGIQPKDKADAHLYADYIVQGTSKGLSGDALVSYAESNVARLQSIMPHLKEKHQVASVAKPTPKTKKPSVAKVTKPAKPKVTKVKFEDFTIVARPDRGGFEGWYGGRAEAFRATVQKVESFFFKKYSRLRPFKIVQ